jgi:trimethylamine--corrinoid protein Co-methyltransferase
VRPFAGEIVQGSAESLSGLVLAQLVRPGVPFVYGAFATVMDISINLLNCSMVETL